ncbi:MAG: hypothetical protein JNJ78_15045 [Anaerolineae bacterium]|nr:hypothetical protein [Anaerolineae bacterium]
MMLTFAYAPEDAKLGDRLKTDLQQKGFESSDTLQKGSGNLLILLVSAASNSNSGVQNALLEALDSGLHIIPVMAENAALPKYIDHLKGLDFTSEYPLETLVKQIETLTSANAGLPMKVLTPAARQKNRGIGLWLGALVIFWFIAGVIAVGLFGIQAPREEYNTIETEVAATIAVIVDKNLPRSTEEAANFPATVQAVPTSQRPLLIATATARAGGE